MTNRNLNPQPQKRVALLVEQDFEDVELQVPVTALQQGEVEPVILGARMYQEYRGRQGKVTVRPQATTAEVEAKAFDAVIIPGGAAPDKLRLHPQTVNFVRAAIAANQLVAAIGHGPQLLIEADAVQDLNITGFRSIRRDLENAGANYLDQPLVVDQNLITSRQPSDLPIFMATILTRLGRGQDLPRSDDLSIDWWRWGEAWGGSRKGEIVQALNTLLRGEHYTRTAFEHYATKTSDPEIRAVLDQVGELKRQHIEMLRVRLAQLDEAESWQAAASEGLATLKSWLQSNDEMALLRRALGDLQTSVGDAAHLCCSLTDPATAAIIRRMEQDILPQEEQIAALYLARWGTSPQAAQPTTGSVP